MAAGFIRRTLFSIAAFMALTAGCSFTGTLDGVFTGTISILDGEASRPIDLTRSVQDVGTFRVDWPNGEVTVRVDETADEIAATGMIEVRAANDATADAALDRLEVLFVVAESLPLRVTLLLEIPDDLSALVSADVEIVLPPGITVDVDLNNGNVSIDGADTTTSAAVNNGRITITNQRGDVAAETNNGNINIDSLSGGINATVNNGSIEITARPADADEITAVTTNGQVDIFIPADTGATIDLETTFGFIDLMLEEFTVTNLRTGQNTTQATLNGGGAPITGRTVAGTVTFGSS